MIIWWNITNNSLYFFWALCWDLPYVGIACLPSFLVAVLFFLSFGILLRNTIAKRKTTYCFRTKKRETLAKQTHDFDEAFCCLQYMQCACVSVCCYIFIIFTSFKRRHSSVDAHFMWLWFVFVPSSWLSFLPFGFVFAIFSIRCQKKYIKQTRWRLMARKE